jgi:LuxR family maltose regulon positive regulatory protein
MSQALHWSKMLLLKTKLAHPPLKEGLVLRERLLRMLDTVSAYRLILLSASAGSGKTTLLATWANRAQRSGMQIAWLSLDEMENDSTRFWVSVITALRMCLPDIGEAVLHELHTPQPPASLTVLTILINEILEQGCEMILVLDDYHLIENPVIHEALAFLLDHLPANFHLVLASRVDPDLSLARWRARGQMLEIRDIDLYFTAEETKNFLTQVSGLPPSEEEIDLLAARTEGWIAGLQLAALALHKHNDRETFLKTFSGSHRYLMDYVQQEILKRLSLPLQQFLLQVAVLPRMNTELCQAVTGEPASQQFLEFLEHNNLFLVPLDSERQWYRLHDLFREVLLVRLHSTLPEQVPHLRLRAARWHEKRRELGEAITQALTAEAFSYAATLMENTIEEIWLRGESQTLYRWIMMLPDAVVREHARLALDAAVYLLNSSASTVDALRIRVRGQVEQILALVEAALQGSAASALPDHEMILLQRRMHVLRLWLEVYEIIANFDMKRLPDIAQSMQQLDQDDEILWQMIPLSTLFTFYQVFLRETGLLVSKLQEARQRVTRNYYATIKVMQWLAMAYEAAGKLRLAYQECLAARALLQQIKGHSILAGYFACCQAYVLYQWNQPEEMLVISQEVIQAATAWQQIDLLKSGYILSGWGLFAVGDLVRVEQVLQKCEQLQLQEPLLVHSYKSVLMTLRVRFWLATGNLAANEWASQVRFHEEDWQPYQRDSFLMWVRVLCLQQRSSEAIEALDRFRYQLNRPGDVMSSLAYLAISVIALRQGGKATPAREALIRLLQMTEPEGFLRLYLDLGEPMCQALQILLDSSQTRTDAGFSRPYVLHLLRAFEQEEQRLVRREIVPAQEAPSQVSSSLAQPALIEPLSPQEQKVLRLLATGRTYAEIAHELIVSLNTIKTQVRSIYRKLGVSRRIEAIEMARTLHLF